MFPSFTISGLEIPYYGLFCIVGVALAIVVAVTRSRITLIPMDDVFYAALYSALGVVAGGKILYLIVDFPRIIEALPLFRENPGIILVYFRGGFVFYGSLGGAIISFYIYCRHYKIGFLSMLDNSIVGVPLAQAFGRIGCFSSGCCYGREYHGIGHVVFGSRGLAPAGVPLFPSQLVESACNIVLFAALFIYARRIRPTGRVTGAYLLSYAVIRFTLEFFRGDAERGFFLGISTSQFISILLLPVGLWLVFADKNKEIHA